MGEPANNDSVELLGGISVPDKLFRFNRSMQHLLVRLSFNDFPRETDLFGSTR